MTPAQKKLMWHLQYGPHDIEWLTEVTGYKVETLREELFKLREWGYVVKHQFSGYAEYALTASGEKYAKVIAKFNPMIWKRRTNGQPIRRRTVSG